MAAHAQRSGQEPDPRAGVDERLGETISLDTEFTTATGETVRIGDLIREGRPAVLNLVYHNCPMLCSLILDGVTATLKDLAWTPGAEFDVFTVSFDPADTPREAQARKARYLDTYGRYGADEGWHFLTGTEASINALTDEVGFRYYWDEETEQFMHTAVLVFISPEGVITRYLYGIQFQADDVRKALVEASAGTIGSTVDRFLYYCYVYDPEANAYVISPMNVMRIGGVMTMLLLGLMLVIFWRRERDRADRILASS
ncbi:MAG: SCO family protein [Bacteroidota bacterium]